jgi:hypothetical protein
MNPEQENFNDLRRLLALKRHEVPPPGYFDGFSQQVVLRIRGGERADAGSFREWLWEAPWLQRVWGLIEARPVIAGVVAAVASGLLIAGVISSDQVPNSSPIAGVPATAEATIISQAAAQIPVSSTEGAIAQLPADPQLSGASQLPGGSLFDELRLGKAGPADQFNLKPVPVSMPVPAPR